ncbi:Rho-binding antiterminator [Pragia fontium]|uniref:Transcriptional antiterminator, Rof n=2 Tax=Pragia fontium TaxID=82985 RepID=A0AAJ4WA82_9GAMM|nr:Rho-binding antiterminator [Pragia fontium]AKJ43019.1 Rho-binding antiterminator [Pragia fontium]SFC70404.1 transcriptional antiterminator, Rof [Pragia fontium DSM 5563 = ATCC 49100]SUB83448.1 Rho-binding antiterminator [Pragia fontium]VEJ56353.1 Rho-binding antiterminator [Pragia fontium]GKX63612.1 Rho-binding antiterminator [Pragia fontium]
MVMTEKEYQPINCDDYDNLELACQHHLVLEIKLRGGERLEAKACDLLLRKQVEYLIVDVAGEQKELRLDNIAYFSHPTIGKIEISLAD